MLRVALSLLGLPLVVLALAATWVFVSAPSAQGAEAVFNMRYQALWYATVVYVTLAVLALPVLVVSLRRGWLAWWQAIAVGALVGALVFAVPLVSTLLDDKLRLAYRLEQIALLGEPALVGAVHGLLFWILALWRNPITRLQASPQSAAAASAT